MTLADQERETRRNLKEIVRARKAEEKANRPARPKRTISKRAVPVAPGQRQPRVRDKLYLGWVARLPCIACAVETGALRFGVHVAHCRMSEAAAGWRNPGLQSKPSDERVTPLCPDHHLRDQHAGAERAFWERLGVNPPDLCSCLRAAYLADGSGLAVVQSFAALARQKSAIAPDIPTPFQGDVL